MKKIVLSLIAVVLLSSFTTDPFRVYGKKVSFKIENPDSSAVNIRIADSHGRNLFSETLTDGEIGKLFNFESAYPDTYYIVVNDGTTTYKKILEVK